MLSLVKLRKTITPQTTTEENKKQTRTNKSKNKVKCMETHQNRRCKTKYEI